MGQPSSWSATHGGSWPWPRYLAVMFTQVGFLGHDAGHRQIFGSRRGQLRPRSSCSRNLCIGLSYGWWVDKHNRHHAHPNDRDAGSRRRAERGGLHQAARRSAARGVARLAVPLPGVPVLPAAAARGDQPARREHPRADQPRLPAPADGGRSCSAFTSSATCCVVFLVLSPVKAVVFIAVHQGLFGLYLGCSFAPNHKGMPTLDARPTSGLPAPPGAHVPQRARWLAHRCRPRRPELPDRAPPVPFDAPSPTCAAPRLWCGRSASNETCPTARRASRVPTPRRCGISTPSAGQIARAR